MERPFDRTRHRSTARAPAAARCGVVAAPLMHRGRAMGWGRDAQVDVQKQAGAAYLKVQEGAQSLYSAYEASYGNVV